MCSRMYQGVLGQLHQERCWHPLLRGTREADLALAADSAWGLHCSDAARRAALGP